MINKVKRKHLVHDVAYYLHRYYPENEITPLDWGIFTALTNFLAGNDSYITSIRLSDNLRNRILDNIRLCKIGCVSLREYLINMLASIED